MRSMLEFHTMAPTKKKEKGKPMDIVLPNVKPASRPRRCCYLRSARGGRWGHIFGNDKLKGETANMRD